MRGVVWLALGLLLLAPEAASAAKKKKAPPPAVTSTPAPPAAPEPTPTPPAPLPPVEKPLMAVLPLRVEALQLNEVQRLNLIVRQRAATRGGYAVQSEQVTTELVEASVGLGLDCDVNDVPCAVELGKVADVPFVLLGHAVGGLDGHIGVDLRIVDVVAGLERRRVSGAIPADQATQLDALNALSQRLFEETSSLSPLSITTEPAGCTVIVNGVARGVTPLAAPVPGLAPGEHVVSVEKKGYLPQRTRFRIAEGEGATLQLTLVVDPDALRTGPSALEIAIPFVAAGAGALVVAGGSIAAVVGLQPYFAFNGHQERIATLTATERDTPGYAQNVADENAQAQAAANEFSSWGQPTLVAGAVAAGVGAVAVVGGLVWGTVLLLTPSVDDGAGAE